MNAGGAVTVAVPRCSILLLNERLMIHSVIRKTLILCYHIIKSSFASMALCEMVTVVSERHHPRPVVFCFSCILRLHTQTKVTA